MPDILVEIRPGVYFYMRDDGMIGLSVDTKREPTTDGIMYLKFTYTTLCRVVKEAGIRYLEREPMADEKFPGVPADPRELELLQEMTEKGTLPEEEFEYFLITGATISEETRDKIIEFFKEARHEKGEVLLIELPKGARIKALTGHIATKLEFIEVNKEEMDDQE